MKKIVYSFLILSVSGVLDGKTQASTHPLLAMASLKEDSWSSQEQEGNQFELQSASDVAIVLHTLFPTAVGAKRVGQEEKLEEAQQKADVLARFLMLLRLAPVHLITCMQKQKGEEGLPWPYAMATVLGHGQRVLITAPDVCAKKIISWIFTGDPDAKTSPAFLKKRAISSHGVQKRGDTFEEIKMGNFSGAVNNLVKGVSGRHLYINMPWGGLGEVGPDGLLNDASGKRYDPRTKTRDNKTKLGHFYVYWDEIDGTAILLVGIETCSPGSQNPFGVAHTLSSGMHDLSKNRSVSGGSKWKVLLGENDRPAEYGGMRVFLDDTSLAATQSMWSRYSKLPDIKKVKYMHNLLEKNAEGDIPLSPSNNVLG